LLFLNAYLHTFSLRSVGVITDETWTLSSPLLPAVRYVLWDCKGILLTEFMAPGTTITSRVYCETLNKLWRLIQNKRRGMLSKGVVLLHNARPHTAVQTNALMKLFNWEIFDHSPYSPDLAPSDYHLFTKMKVWLATQRFHTNEELVDGVNTWLHNLAAPFFDE